MDAPSPGAAAEDRSGLVASMVDAGDMYATWRDLKNYFRQFGFMDWSTPQRFFLDVVVANARPTPSALRRALAAAQPVPQAAPSSTPGGPD